MNGPSDQKVIYVWNYVDWGGAQIYFFGLIKEVRKHWVVKVLLPANCDQMILERMREIGVEWEFLPPAESLRSAGTVREKLGVHWRKFWSEHRLVKSLGSQRLGDAIVHIDMGFWQSFLPLFRLCMMTNVFVTVHTALPNLSSIRGIGWRIKGRILNNFRSFRVIASNQDARIGLYPYLGKKADSIPVAYSGYDPDEIDSISLEGPGKQELRLNYDIPGDFFLIVTSGQFIERKGCWVVLDSLTLLKERFKDFLFVWLGTSDATTEMTERVRQLELEDNFRFISGNDIGDRHEVLSIIALADLFVMASFKEGVATALIEAMVLGKPCIATNVNATPEAVTDGMNGILIEPGAPLDLCNAIDRLRRNEELRVRIGREAQATVAKFNQKKAAAVMLDQYRGVFRNEGSVSTKLSNREI